MVGEKKKALAIQFLAELARGKQVGIIPIFFSPLYQIRKKIKEKWSEYDEKQKNYIIGYYFYDWRSCLSASKTADHCTLLSQFVHAI
ncbi:hypothetical protein [Enterococcus casseliflavus]|uniref:hypothetical protein n=1 Tax=Enterococcus casseliflavus TaxID=37734 RepID=UPI003D0F300A